MSKMTPHELMDSLTSQFSVEVSICEVFQKRWSHITSSANFVCGNHRLMLSNDYGIMLHCNNQTFQEIAAYLKKIELSN